MALVIPRWLDQVPQVDFSEEKRFLTQIENWASEEGWVVSDGGELSQPLRQRTDVLLSDVPGRRSIRFAVLPKKRGRPGQLTADFSNFRTADFVFDPKSKDWKLLLGATPIEPRFRAKVQESGWRWFINLLFAE